MKQCPFCDCKERIILKNELAFAIFDNYPVSPGHLLIIPFRHVPDYFGATRDEKIAIIDLIEEAKEILDEKFNPDGYNIGVNIGRDAGQSVIHLHVHIIPRFKGDMKNPRGGVRRVIPGKRNYKEL